MPCRSAGHANAAAGLRVSRYARYGVRSSRVIMTRWDAPEHEKPDRRTYADFAEFFTAVMNAIPARAHLPRFARGSAATAVLVVTAQVGLAAVGHLAVALREA